MFVGNMAKPVAWPPNPITERCRSLCPATARADTLSRFSPPCPQSYRHQSQRIIRQALHKKPLRNTLPISVWRRLCSSSFAASYSRVWCFSDPVRRVSVVISFCPFHTSIHNGQLRTVRTAFHGEHYPLPSVIRVHRPPCRPSPSSTMFRLLRRSTDKTSRVATSPTLHAGPCPVVVVGVVPFLVGVENMGCAGLGFPEPLTRTIFYCPWKGQMICRSWIKGCAMRARPSGCCDTTYCGISASLYSG